ncbi:MAG: peptidase T [Clostridia bacterium]|nr:peptidase T [Clostridia bacterium]
MTVTERFLKYVSYPTMSVSESDTVPTTEKQKILGKALADELREMGLTDAHIDNKGYIYATLPSNTDKETNTIGFIAHMDTSEAASDENIKANIVEYSGGNILLDAEKDIYMKTSEYPCLEKYIGDHLIVTDGTTLLGADDKAGIAEIFTMLERLIASGEEHGTIKIGITPDEEVGRGADHFDVEKFAADYAYTVDGGALGELEYENFNAAGATVVIHGVSIHPGSAKNKMKNAVTMAMEFNALLPALEVPERTEGYEGFHNLYKMTAETELATMSYILRDHDKDKIAQMKSQFLKAADEMNYRYGEGTVEVHLRDSYSNMKEIIENHMYIIDRAKKAMADVGIEPNIVPIRGGTDGARLSFRGLPCPNLCTGGENFHSRFEFVSIESMEKITDLLLQIVKNSVPDGIAR